MSDLQPIIYRGQLEAVVIGQEATIIDDGRLPNEDLLEVKAMCLYAIEIAAGHHPGPYREEQALAYALQAREARRDDE